MHKHGTCSVCCVRWSGFDELQKNPKKQEGKKKIETFVQTVATILPLIARSAGAPESRSDCLEFKRRRTFQNFTASKLQGKKKKTCVDPLTGFGGAAETAMFCTERSVFAANVVLFFWPTLFFFGLPVWDVGPRRVPVQRCLILKNFSPHLQPSENGTFPPFPSESHILASL